MKAALKRGFMRCQFALKCLFFSQSNQAVTTLPRGIALDFAIAECIAAKTVAARRPLYVKSLRQSLTAFGREHKGFLIQQVTPDVIEKWLARFKGGYYRLMWQYRLSTLLAFCVRRKYLDRNPCDCLEKITVEKLEPQILTPVQIRDALDFARRKYPRFLPWLALAVFAGVRPDELLRLTWQDVDLTNSRVTIRGAASKVHRRRFTPLAPCAVAWLKLGGDLPIAHTSKRRYIRAIRDRLALTKWPQDALRHTAASMMLAREQDAGRVALWLGNSTKILLSHYQHLSGKEEADLFWKIFPREMQPELNFDAPAFEHQSLIPACGVRLRSVR